MAIPMDRAKNFSRVVKGVFRGRPADDSIPYLRMNKDFSFTDPSKHENAGMPEPGYIQAFRQQTGNSNIPPAPPMGSAVPRKTIVPKTFSTGPRDKTGDLKL